MKNGFTLVELSIVLVIIGLLVGGVLVGQSLIDSAKLNSAIRQIQQYDIAVSQFKGKYRGLPGDSRHFGGDGDGEIRDADGGSSDKFSAEVAGFWVHLSQTELKSTNYQANISGSFSQVEENYPEFVWGNNIIYGAMSHEAAVPVAPFYSLKGDNIYVIGNYNFASSDQGVALNGTEAIDIANVVAIDQKIDDSLPMQGDVNAGLNGQGVTTCHDALNPSGPYLIDGTDKDCAIAIRILSQSEF